MSHEVSGSTDQHGRTLPELHEAIAKSTPRTLSASHTEAFLAFLPLYYGSVPLQDLQTTLPEDLNGMALSHWQLAQQRKKQSSNLSAFNPHLEQDGWQSMHTIVELVTEDQPHLVASLRTALLASGYSIHLIIHPVLRVSRDDNGKLVEITSANRCTSQANTQEPHRFIDESLILIEMDHVADEQLSHIEAIITNVLNFLNTVRQDASAMADAVDVLATKASAKNDTQFFQWLSNIAFVSFGHAALTMHADQQKIDTVSNTLGVFKQGNEAAIWQLSDLMPSETISALNSHESTLMVCKADKRSAIIRDEFADLILHIQRDKNGRATEINCIVGLFVSGLHGETLESIPILSERLSNILDASEAAPDSHDGRALASVIRGFPKGMLLQANTNELLEMANGIVSLHERLQIRMFHSVDPLGRFCNCLVYIPRDTYSRELRLNIESILLSSIDGSRAEFFTHFSSESELARLHFVVQKNPPLNRTIDWRNVETRIRNAAITWNDRLLGTLREKHNEHDAMHLFRRYEHAFPASYKEDYSARIAVSDIRFIETKVSQEAPIMSFYRHIVADTGTINFKLFSVGSPVTLSDAIPIIENMGLRVESEHPFEIKRDALPNVWMHEFTVEQVGQSKLDSKQSANNIQEAFSRIWSKSVENDGFNRLILEAGLTWREVVILRSYCKYLLQIGVPFSQSYMIDSLVSNNEITRSIANLFAQRFDPSISNREENEFNIDLVHADDVEQTLEKSKTLALYMDIVLALEKVASLDEDRILRSYLNLVAATLRTNAFCVDEQGQQLNYISYKFDCSKINELPLPRPMAEIFVYSADFEAIHLRGGRVARGGLRWSDRREDFRTEVLGLMKAQMVKNSVIVPVGSKGGFYVKQALSNDRETMMQQVINCYQNFLRGLLDITDNIVNNTIVAPQNVIRYDEDDPYLVVAADKGTATFSDFANAVSMEYGFWLGDAFASGGSAGYDHKKMGITARGAWESVKRHFRELGHDCQTQDFTVVGVGDMAGDVFGNGMLLSKHIGLVAAFNHQHIFIDPTPDTATSYVERERLFQLPRSSWTDYNQKLISAGGGIYSRSDKRIELSAQAQTALGTDKANFTPNELINTLLKAPADLLWNGGIGTYVKASTQTHADAADRANDAVRVNANELRCRVFGEGGNLGCTQLARIEYARAGGMMYTDAIDNSAGVDCSDHEVNIKILLNAVVANDDMTLKQRDKLLVEMTDEVASLVLTDNYLQTQCINQCYAGGTNALNELQRFMQHLESINRLDRPIEFLPDNEQIADRLAADEGLSRPEVSVLVSYSKMVMYDELLDSTFAEEPALQKMLIDYFPKVLGERFGDKIAEHRLRPEIIVSVVCNEFVNRLGPSFAFRMQHELGATAQEVATAFVAVVSIFKLPALWQSIEQLDNQVPADMQNQMQILVRGLVERATHWLLRSRRGIHSIDNVITQFKPGIEELIVSMPESLARVNRQTLDQRVNYFVNAGVPAETAMAVSQVVPLSSSLDIVEIASSTNALVGDVAKVYFELGHHLELQWLRDNISELQVRSHWHTLSKSELRSDLHYQQRHLTAEVLTSAGDQKTPSAMVKRWSQANQAAVDKYSDLIVDMKASSAVDFAMLSLAVNEVHKLLRSDRPLVSG